MYCFISSFNMTSPPALSQGEGDRAEGLRSFIYNNRTLYTSYYLYVGISF